MLGWLDPLSTKHIILLSPLICLVISQVTISQNIILKLRNEEGFTIQYQSVSSLSSIKDVIDSAGSIIFINIFELKLHLFSNDVLLHLKMRAPVKPRKIDCVL